MSPINPNFKPGVGHLVTDRYDFQKHIDGEDFRQAAGTVDLSPTVTIGSTEIFNVQTAIEALAGSIIVPSVPDATTASKGVIQLNGDLFGLGTTALAPKVSGLQGYPITSTTPMANQVLQWNGSSWAPSTIVNASSSVFGTIKLLGDLNGGTASSPVVTGIQSRTVSASAPSTGQALVWSGTAWTPTGIPSTPTGTGFATLTGGTYDASATGNIRYSGGKFQTDTNIQWLNGGIFGDLAWAPTTSNKTLTLPDVTDTLVARTTTDTLTNKTINATNNTITDTSAVLGDILAVVSGSKFSRLAKGANGTFLGVSGGVLGYYTPSGGTPSGTGFATVTGGVFDGSATANLRYTGGKFQTDTNIQFKTGVQIGDLSWPTITASRTLSLPDITDTLVARTTTDTLTNKTISATLNTITASSIATGDILKSDGTSFQRFARGTALQFLRVNAGGTDLEWATSSSSSSGAANTIQTSDGSGGFLAATDVLAAATYISMGSTPATSGYLRFPYNATDTIIAVKDNSSTTREVISRPAVNSLQFGPSTTNALGVTLTGNTVDLKPANQIRFYGQTGVVAMTIGAVGQMVMNPNNFEGLTINQNTGATGAIALLFGGVSGLGSTDNKYLGIGNSPSPPSATPTGGGYLYVEAGALKYRGSSGTLTTIATAEPHCKKCGRDFTYEWQNDNYGKLVTCMPCLLDALQSLGIDVDTFSDRNLT